MKKIGIITVGNEVLSGRTVDTNATWLSQKFIEGDRDITIRLTVSDDESEIQAALQFLREREIDFIVTIGGLGPTFDDLTVAAIAHWCNLELIEFGDVLAEIGNKYQKLFLKGLVDFPELNEARRKMAKLPAGSKALPNDVGISPGVWLTLSWGDIVALPGVPAEMKSIAKSSLLPVISPGNNPVIKSEEFQSSFRDESQLAEFIDAIMAEFPGLYIKSHASKFAHDTFLIIQLTVHAETEDEADEILNKSKKRLLQAN